MLLRRPSLDDQPFLLDGDSDHEINVNPAFSCVAVHALQQLPEIPFEIPENILFVNVDPETGLLAADHGGQGTVEIFLKGTEPTQSAPPRTDSTRFYQIDQGLEGAADLPVTTQP